MMGFTSYPDCDINFHRNIMVGLMVILSSSVTSGCECGREVHLHRIVHGRPTNSHKYPWMAFIRFQWGPKKQSFCGGTLIDYQHVVTAAHCLFGHDDGTPAYLEEIHVFLGTTKRPEQSLYHWSASDYTYDIRFNPSTSPILFDLAVLKLDKPVHWFLRDLIHPICLPRSNYHVYRMLTVAGYGYNDTKGQPTEDIHEVDVNYIPYRKCARIWLKLIKHLIKTNDLDDGIPFLDLSHICAINIKTRGASCFGDSGGPLMYKNPANDRWYLIGVVSGGWVYECADSEYPDIYTSIAVYRYFIKSYATSPCFKRYF